MTRPARLWGVNGPHTAVWFTPAHASSSSAAPPYAIVAAPLPAWFRPPPSEMTRPERLRGVSGPRTLRFTPAHASSAAPPSTEGKQDASSPPGLTRKYEMASSMKKRLPSAAAAPFMPTRAGAKKVEVRKEMKTAAAPTVEKCFHSTVGNEKSCLPCPRTTSTCAETAAGISRFHKKPEINRMSFGVPVDGSSEEDEEGDDLTPPTIGSYVRGSRSSPNEKSMSSEEEITSKGTLKEKQKAELYKKIEQVQQMARECGADENNPYLWLGVLELVHSDRATKFFMGTDRVGRMAIIKHFARIHEGEDLGDIQKKSLLKRDSERAKDSDVDRKELFNFAPSSSRLSKSSRTRFSSSPTLSKGSKSTTW